MDYVYEVNDPLLGFVSCETREDAIAYAKRINAQVFRAAWENGEMTRRERIWPIRDSGQGHSGQ